MKHLKYLLTGTALIGLPVAIGLGIGLLMRTMPVVGYTVFGLVLLTFVYLYGRKTLENNA
jgi:hypothetical protein